MTSLHSPGRCALFKISVTIAFVGMASLARISAADPSSATYPEVSVRANDSADYNWAKLDLEARIAYVSSGPKSLAFSMIDGDPRTVFRFSGADLHPTVIVELVRNEQLHRVTTVFHAQNVKVNVFLLNSLPNNVDDLGGAKALTCGLDKFDLGKAGVEFDPSNAHFVAVQWTRPAATAAPFEVAEVSAFGIASRAELPPALPDVHFARESGQDFSNGLGTLAQPPAIVAVSP